jgi:asparagine synthase (glutamine-hydrolysing)
MCGICGIYNFDGEKIRKDLVGRMTETLRHRGPDGEGKYDKGHVGLGHRRLSILDLSDAGSQPMCNEDGKIWITYNGEVYNYPELREELAGLGHTFKSKTDTETIIHAYEEFGPDCLKRLNGMFAFAIYDEDKDLLFCARDRYGVKPFYYRTNGKSFVFASEIKALLADSSFPRRQNDRMIYDYLMFNRYDHSRETFFEGVFRLPPSRYALIRRGGTEEKTWWETTVRDAGRISPKVAADAFRGLFTDSVRMRLRSDVPVGSCLSGGLDSSSIVCTVDGLIGQKEAFRTYSAVYDRQWERDESRYIEKVIERTGFQSSYTSPDGKGLLQDLSEFIYHQEEPLGHTSFFAQWSVMKLAQSHGAKVLLDGQGGDELLAGYRYMFGYYFRELLGKGRFLALAKEIAGYMRYQRDYFGFLLFIFLLAPSWLQRAIAYRVNVGAGITGRRWIARDFHRRHERGSMVLDDFVNSKTLNAALKGHFDHKLEHLLRCEDRSAMAFSIETRLPFLDYRLVDFLFTIPSQMKIRGGKTKVILREAMKELLPEEISNRMSKFGFETKEDEWFRTSPMRERVADIIYSESFRMRPYYDENEVRNELEGFFEGKRNISRTVWKWINLELWLRMFIDTGGKPAEEAPAERAMGGP